MNSKLWIRKALTTCSLVALVATYSMVALAGPGKVAGELTVLGSDQGETSFVTVNGEPARSGRTVFTSSTITTPETMGAAINFGKAGRIEFTPGTTFAVNFDGDAISGNLAAGSLTVSNSTRPVSVVNASGDTVALNAGETATATGKAARDRRDSSGTCIDTDKDGDTECDEGMSGWIWALVLGGAAAAILIAANADNDNDFGASASTLSPTR